MSKKFPSLTFDLGKSRSKKHLNLGSASPKDGLLSVPHSEESRWESGIGEDANAVKSRFSF